MSETRTPKTQAKGANFRFDTATGRTVVLKGPPDTYKKGHNWVQPAEGGPGWLAACTDLEPAKGRRP